MADDLIDPLQAAQGAANAGGDAAADDALFKEFSKAKDDGLALPPEPEPNQTKADGGQAAEPVAGEAKDDGAAKAASKPETPPAAGSPKADDADDPKALKAALEAAKSDVEKLSRDFHAYKSQEGRRLAALQGKNVPGVDVPKTPAADGAAPVAAPKPDEDDPLASPEFQKVREEYGDVIAPLEKVIKHLQGKLSALDGRTAAAEKDLSGLTAAQANEYVAEQSAALTAKHKDWQEICSSDDFEKWLADQPEEVQGLVTKNKDRIVDAKAGARALDFYKSDRGIGREKPADPTPTPEPARGKDGGKGGQSATSPAQDSRRQRQLESSTAIPDKGPGPAGGPTGDDDQALFRHFAALKDKELAAGRI